MQIKIVIKLYSSQTEKHFRNLLPRRDFNCKTKWFPFVAEHLQVNIVMSDQAKLYTQKTEFHESLLKLKMNQDSVGISIG